MKMMAFFMCLFISGQILYTEFDYQLIRSKDIEMAEGKIKLKLVQSWGGETAEENMVFKIPKKICFDVKGNFYVLDAGQRFVKKYDSKGNNLNSIGRFGEGPGEYVQPGDLFVDQKDNVYVLDTMKNFENKYDSNGKYLKRIKTKNHIVSASVLPSSQRLVLEMNFRKGLTFAIIKRTGEYRFIQTITELNCNRKAGGTWEQIWWTMDHRENVFVSLQGTPLIRKFSSDGNLRFERSFQLPYKTYRKRLSGRSDQHLRFELKGGERVLYGMATDLKGNLYLVRKIRKMPSDLKKIYSIISSGSGMKKALKVPPPVKQINFFQLMVFSPEGELLGAKKLNVFCDKIEIHKGYLYVLDTYYDTMIYKYKINF